MAGMFYSLKEAAAKLNMTEKEVRELAKQGKLREFRDGSNLLFKIDEVEALMSGAGVSASEDTSFLSEQPDESAGAIESDSAAEPEEAQEIEQPTAAEKTAETAEEEKEEEILLAPEAKAPTTEGDLSSADTAITSEGISVLGETDKDYQLTEDAMAETTIAPGTASTAGISGTTGEASLEEIEDDVNLDTFGSGSGLLDLSLQADDTSLGGILDEIYTTEGGEEGQEPGEPSSAAEMAAEEEPAEGGIPEEELVGPPIVSEAPEVQAIAQPSVYIEAPPDAFSNSLGVMLFLPLLALIYAAIITLAGLKNTIPTILSRIKVPYIGLYIMAGFLLAAALTFGVSFMLSGGLGKAGVKEKKPKKPKPKKAKKSKKSAPEEAAE